MPLDDGRNGKPFANRVLQRRGVLLERLSFDQELAVVGQFAQRGAGIDLLADRRFDLCSLKEMRAGTPGGSGLFERRKERHSVDEDPFVEYPRQLFLGQPQKQKPLAFGADFRE